MLVDKKALTGTGKGFDDYYPTPFFEPHTPYNSFDLLHKQALLHELFFVLFSFFDFLLQKVLQISQKNDFDPFCSTHISSYEYRQMISTPFFLALPSIESDGPTYLITFHHAHSNNLRHRNNQRNRPNTNQKIFGIEKAVDAWLCSSRMIFIGEILFYGIVPFVPHLGDDAVDTSGSKNQIFPGIEIIQICGISLSVLDFHIMPDIARRLAKRSVADSGFRHSNIWNTVYDSILILLRLSLGKFFDIPVLLLL